MKKIVVVGLAIGGLKTCQYLFYLNLVFRHPNAINIFHGDNDDNEEKMEEKSTKMKKVSATT